MTVPVRNVASISVNAYVELLIVIARSRVQAISYANAVPPTTANRKSRKANVGCYGSAIAEVTIEGEAFTSCGLLSSFAIRWAIRPARILRATADATVTCRPSAGSSTNPEINVPGNRAQRIDPIQLTDADAQFGRIPCYAANQDWKGAPPSKTSE
jgi:hypothetical protein